MLLPFILLLISGTVAGQRASLRQSRQLDLGLQDISYSKNTSTPVLTLPDSKDYLPPVVEAQSHQNFQFKSADEDKSKFCKPPFDVIFCRSKDEILNASSKSLPGIIPKPSQDLVPPFNELELDAGLKSLLSPKRLNQEAANSIPTKTESHLDFSAFGTLKSGANSFKLDELTKATSLLKQENPKQGNETFVSNNAQATNELRSYLPPQSEYTAAAQTAVNVIQPADDHHHGHHHHGGNICDDAFHSFLCAPLKARKRITGALPNSLKGQGSVVQYQKVLPSPDKEPASSNTLQNEYLPPRNSELSGASSRSESTYAPPTPQRRIVTTTTTTTTTTVRPSPSILEPVYLGPAYLPPTAGNSIAPPFINPDSSNQVNTALPISSTTRILPTVSTPIITPNQFSFAYIAPLVTEKPLFVSPISSTELITTGKIVPDAPLLEIFPTRNSISPAIPTFSPQASNGDRFYLPPDPSPQPAASFISTARNFYAKPSSFVPQSTTSFSFVTTTKAPYSKPFSFSPSNRDNYVIHPQVKSAVNFKSTTLKPFTTTTQKPYPSTSDIIKQASATEDRSYLPPDPNIEPQAAQVDPAVVQPQVKNPFHHGRDLCTDPFHSFLCVGPKPRKRITGALPAGLRPDSSNANELKVKPAPSDQNERKVKPDKPIDSSPTQAVGYRYPKPSRPFPSQSTLPSTTAAPPTGYSYPKPEKIFPLPSQQQEVIRTTTTPAPSKKPSVSVFETSEARINTGYQYPKPEQKFPLPSEQESDRIPTTVKPSTGGYSYPKPEKSFPLPTEQKEVRYSKPVPVPTRAPSPSTLAPSVALPSNQGYQYPKPQQSFELPERKGYSYPKPEKRLELPTENQSKLSTNFDSNRSSNLGSAEFIPVNKVNLPRDESTNLLSRYQRFGERLKKREKGSSK